MPATHALDLYRGDTYAGEFVLWADDERTIPVDLAGVVPRSQIRRVPLAAELLVELTCSIEAPNVVHVSLAASSWPADPFTAAVWDLELTYPDGVVQTVLAGPVRVSGDVTAAIA